MEQAIAELIGQMGYAGVALAVLVETLIPPIPSELIMPLVGLAAARGEISLAGGIAAAVAGSTLGALAWYGAARALGLDRLRARLPRFGRRRDDRPRAMDRAMARFGAYGGWAVFLGRVLPGARVIISVPAGLARMPVAKFTLLTTAGFTVWYGFLGGAGYAFSEALQAGGGLLIAALFTLFATAALGARAIARRAPSRRSERVSS